MGGQIGQALTARTNTPTALVQRYRDDFAAVMPAHLRPDTWVRHAQGALRRDAKLLAAAQSSPESLMTALATAARLGLEPASEMFYLVPRRRKGRLEVQGIVGYQGLVELIYRAGHARSVHVEAVRERDDFMWAPGAVDHLVPERWAGRQERPWHRADWFGDRGALAGVYAYAQLAGGATSKVVVLGPAEIAKIRAKSDGADGEYSPWRTDEEAMWLKSAVRRLAKWVPTSADIRTPTPAPAPGAAVAQAPVSEPAEQPEPVWDAELLDDTDTDTDVEEER